MSDLHIPTPCHENWDAMTPAGNGRHCATCNHQVIDVASMPVAEGRRVLSAVATTLGNGGKRTCVRAHVTPSGRLVAGRRKLLTTALAGILASSIAGYAGEGPDLSRTTPVTPPVSTQPHPARMGDIAVTIPKTPMVKGEVCAVPVKGKIVAPVPADPPKPERKPEDGVQVGTVSVEGGDHPQPPIAPDKPRAP